MNITPAAMQVRGALDDTIRLTVGEIAKRAGVSESSTRKHLNTLHSLGDVQVTRGVRGGYKYRLLTAAEQNQRDVDRHTAERVKNALRTYGVPGEVYQNTRGGVTVHLSGEAFEALVLAAYEAGTVGRAL